MANWASTSYRIEGNKKDLQELFNLIKAFDTGERKPFDEKTDKEWEGNIVWALGGEPITGQNTYRGFIQTYELDDKLLSIEAEEAWVVTDFRSFLEEHYENMKVYFCSEENGCDYFVTNDKEGKYFGYTCMVDYYIEGKGDDVEYFSSKDKLLAYVAKTLGVSSITEEEIEEWNEEHEDEDDHINIYDFEIVD